MTQGIHPRLKTVPAAAPSPAGAGLSPALALGAGGTLPLVAPDSSVFARRGMGLWTFSLAMIAGLHAGAAALVVYWPQDDMAAPPPAAMMIELAPMPSAPVTPPQEVPPAPKQEEASKPPEPVVEDKPEPEPPPPPPQVKPEVVKPKPPPKPKPVVKKPPPEAPPADKPPVEQTTAPPTTAAPPAPTAAAPAPGASDAPPSNAVPTWQGTLLAHLERHKRYPAAAQARRQQGVATVRFTIDRSGNVLSAKLERSSSQSLLDKESLALLERAQPLPPPPPEMTGETIELVVPVQFFLK